MLVSRLPDVVAPNVPSDGLFLGLLLLILFSAITEAIALTALRWDAFRRSLVAALLMNIISIVLQIAVELIFDFDRFNGWSPNASNYFLSVFIEYGVLMLFRRGAVRQNLIAALVANTVSYVLFAGILFVWVLFFFW